METGNLVLTRCGNTFPVGTVVGLYQGVLSNGGVPTPAGQPVATATVAFTESLTFEGVEETQAAYYAAAKVNGAWRLIQTTTRVGSAEPGEGPPGPEGPPGEVTKAEIETKADLDGNAKLVESQLPDSVVTSSGTLHSRSFLKYDGVDFIDVPDYVMRPAEHGAKENGTTDDSAAIQKCIDEAQEAQSTANTTAVVELGHLHAVANTIVQKTAPVVARHPWINQLVWTGANGGIVIQKEMDFEYPASILSAIRGFAMVNDGVHVPKTWINFGTESWPDSLMDLSWLRFEEASGPAIVLPNFVTQSNWEHLWFDCPCEYLIKIGVNEGRAKALLTLDQCQFGAQASRPGNGKALFFIDNPHGQNMGTFKVSNSRIENGRILAAPHAIVAYKLGVERDHTLELAFDNVVYSDTGGATEDVLFAQEGEKGSPYITIHDCDFSQFTRLLSGTLPTNFPTFDPDHWADLRITRGGGVGQRANVGAEGQRLLETRRASAGSSKHLQAFHDNQTIERFNIDFAGTMNWGEGAAATDTQLSRVAAGALTVPSLELTKDSQEVASANTITPAKYRHVWLITGTTEIKKITAVNAGIYVLKFAGALTVKKGENLKLKEDFTTTADDTLTLACDGTNFYEMCRSVN